MLLLPTGNIHFYEIHDTNIQGFTSVAMEDAGQWAFSSLESLHGFAYNHDKDNVITGEKSWRESAIKD